MEEILDRFKDFCKQPYRRAEEWKNVHQRKIIGCIPMYFPDEIIHAAGVLPVTIFGIDEPITLADKHLMTNACNQVRSTFDGLLKGRYDFLDGIAALHVCDQVRFFLEIWQLDHPFPFFHQMWRPYKIDSTNRPFLVSELKRLKACLEKYIGNEITSDALRQSFRIYNKSRALMRTLNDLRRDQPGIISAADMTNVVTSSMLMPREEHNELLKELLSKAGGTEIKGDNKIRLVISGHPCAIPDARLLNLIEDLGTVIIDDDFFSGGRYFAMDVRPDGDPIEAFADYYMKAIPCTTYHYPENWRGDRKTYSRYGDYIIEMVRRAQAKGVLFLRVMYCDPYDLEFVMLKEKLEEEDIPYLSLITEHEPGTLGPIRTRVQAFIEMLNANER